MSIRQRCRAYDEGIGCASTSSACDSRQKGAPADIFFHISSYVIRLLRGLKVADFHDSPLSVTFPHQALAPLAVVNGACGYAISLLL